MRGLRDKRFVWALITALALPLTTSGCFGRFMLTRKVYRFNWDLSHDRWVRWFGFLVMVVFPIYGGAGLIDLVFGNSIEFWGGSSPFAAAEPRTRHALGPNGEQITATRVETDVILLTVTQPDGESRSVRVVREPTALAAYDASGALLARVGDVNGAPGLLEEPEPAR